MRIASQASSEFRAWRAMPYLEGRALSGTAGLSGCFCAGATACVWMPSRCGSVADSGLLPMSLLLTEASLLLLLS